MTLALYGTPAALLIYALIEALREAGLPGRLAPLVAIALGCLLGCAYEYHLLHPDYIQGILVGLPAGLASSGLQSGVKTRIQAAAAAFAAAVESKTAAPVTRLPEAAAVPYGTRDLPFTPAEAKTPLVNTPVVSSPGQPAPVAPVVSPVTAEATTTAAPVA